MKLSDRNWKEFYLSEIFAISSTQSGIDKKKLNQKCGSIPYVTRTDKNNGIDNFIAVQDSKYKFDLENVITIGLDTQTAFYQPHKFYTGQNIQILCNQNINKYTALFMLPSLKVLLRKFSWGSNGATLGRLKNSSIYLPVTADSRPDYAFMEAYMQEKETKLKEQYKKFVASRFDKKIEKPEKPKKWKPFNLEKIFEVNKGIYLHSSKIKKGLHPYITAKTSNNGINEFIDYPTSFKGNTITINKVKFSSFYQPKAFYCSHDVSTLTNMHINKYSGLFICSMLNRNAIKYSYGRQAQINVVKRELVYLPTNCYGEPDYIYMENYMKYLEQKKLAEYLKYIEKSERI